MFKSFQIPLIGQGILIAIIVSFIFSLFLGIVYVFTSVPESSLYSTICLSLGVLAGSIYTSFKAGSKGLIYGTLIGIGFILFTVIVFFIFNSSSPTTSILLIKSAAALISGAIGGTIGAFLKK